MRLSNIRVKTLDGDSTDIGFVLDHNTGHVVSFIRGACYCPECSTPTGEGETRADAAEMLLGFMDDVDAEEAARVIAELTESPN